VRFSRAFLVTFLSREVALAFSFLNAVVLARGLGTEGLGTYSLVVTAANLLAQAGALGVNYANNYLVARDPSTAGKLFSQSFFPAAGVTLAGSIVALQWPQATRWAIGALPVGYPFMVFLGTGLIILNMNLGSLLLGLKEFKAQGFVSALGPVGMGLSNALAVGVLGKSGVAALRIWLGWTAAMGVVSCFFVARRAAPVWAIDGRLFADSVRVGFRALATTVLSFTAQRGTLLLIDRQLGRAAVGTYAVVLPLAEVLVHIPATLGTLLLTDASARGDTRPVLAQLLRLHIVLTAVAAAALALLAPLLLPLLFGSRFGSSVLPFQVLLIGYYFMGFWALCSSDLAGRHGYPVSLIFLTGLFAALVLGLGIWWTPLCGLVGMASAWSAAAVVLSLATLLIYFRDAGVALGSTDLIPRRQDFAIAWRALLGRGGV
jgi:O-antigen/teichoic acid export membrane protein